MTVPHQSEEAAEQNILGDSPAKTHSPTPAPRPPGMLSGESSADFVRRMGWGPGTRLIGDEGYGPTTITITAVGRHKILAARNNDRETVWTLAHRPWREVP